MTRKPKPSQPMATPASPFLLYTAEDGRIRLEVHLRDETVWLSLNQMADLFQRDKSTISRHITNIFEEGELERGRVVADFATTATDGKTYQVEYFNLDVIISVGYRVKDQKASSHSFKTRCIGLPTAIRHPKSSTNERTGPSQTWASPSGLEPGPGRLMLV